MTDHITLPRSVVDHEIEALVESARLLGGVQSRKEFGTYTQDDARFETAMYESIYKHKKSIRAALAGAAQAEPVEWAKYDLDEMAEAFQRVIEAHHHKTSPFHNPIDADARIALRILRGLIPAMKKYTAPQPAQPVAVPNDYSDYNMIDRFLRNNLDDDDYATFSTALDNIMASNTPSK